MKAMVYTQYGPPEMLQLKEVEKPTLQDHQILVKVHAASVNALDYRRFEKASLMGRFMDERLMKAVNKALGVDVAGVVEAVGKEVTEFQPGDPVFGVAPSSFAEYVVNGASKFVHKPANVSFEQAAAVPVAAFTALQGLRDKSQIRAGQKVLIDGASGGVGIFAVQIAKSFGAEVTAVCSTRNLEMVRSLGADHVLDYTQEDFTQGGERYDFIYAVNGHHSLLAYRKALKPQGICVIAGGPMSQVFSTMIFGPIISLMGSKRIRFQGIATTPKEDLLVLKELLETGKLIPVLDKTYPLHALPKAIRYLIDEHARGKVIIAIEPADTKTL